jgi:hypothetical protein
MLNPVPPLELSVGLGVQAEATGSSSAVLREAVALLQA